VEKMRSKYIIKVQEYHKGEKYGHPFAMRNENNKILFFKDLQYAEQLAKELNNSPIRSYYVEEWIG
jgi:asparagine synthetase B (glutamine-hydrolysing)